MSIGISEILLILVLIIAIAKPDKLGEYVASAKKTMQKIREVNAEVTDTINVVKAPVDEVKDSLNESLSEVKDTLNEVKEQINEEINIDTKETTNSKE